MSTLQIEQRGKGKPAQLRRQGLLPVALIERNHETSLYQTSITSLKTAMAAADGLGRVDVEIAGGGKKKAIVKNIEKNFVRQEILTVTLQEVSEDDVMKMDIPVVAINAPADIDGQDVTLMHPTDHVKVRGKMSAMPSQIEVDCSKLQPGDHINAGDIKLPEGIELLSSADSTLFSLQHVKEVSLEPEIGEEPSEEATEEASE